MNSTDKEISYNMFNKLPIELLINFKVPSGINNEFENIFTEIKNTKNITFYVMPKITSNSVIMRCKPDHIFYICKRWNFISDGNQLLRAFENDIFY